jgi:hypothetical protein
MSLSSSRRALGAAAAAIVVAMLWPCASVGAQGVLASAKQLRCTFGRQAAGSWKKDGTLDAAVTPANLILRFDSIDPDSGTAQLRTGSASSEVTARLAEGYLHLMQSFRTGPLYTTTVFTQGGANGKFKAVHSRHEYFTTPLPGATSSPEQYYGECEIVR